METKVSKHYAQKPFTSILCHSSPNICRSLFDEVLSPLPRSGHRMVCVGHNLYLFGGYNPNLDKEHCDPYWQRTNPLFAELWQYNTVSNQWRPFYQCYMSRSDGLVSFGCAVSGYTMFHIGGTGAPFGQCSHNRVQACDLNSGVWQELSTNGELPQPAYGQGVVLDDNDLYVVGGTTGYEYSLDVHHINVVEKKWSKLTKVQPGWLLPMPRYRHEVVMHKEELLVIGGGQKEVTASLDILAAFSLAERSWRSIATQPDPASQRYPAPRKCHITVHHGNYVYIHGGCNENRSFGDMWRLNLQTWRWEQLVDGTTSPRHFHSAALTEEGCLYMHGGVFESGERTGELIKCWLSLPSLSRLCWDALLQHNPRLLEDTTPIALYHLGVPSKLIKQCELMPDRSTIPPPVFPPPEAEDLAGTGEGAVMEGEEQVVNEEDEDDDDNMWVAIGADQL